MWMLCLTAAAVFTGLTYFAVTFWQLAVMKMLASGFAIAELAVSITIVNEQVPARHRGLLYRRGKAQVGRVGESKELCPYWGCAPRDRCRGTLPRSATGAVKSSQDLPKPSWGSAKSS
jgi:hypothetical protein